MNLQTLTSEEIYTLLQRQKLFVASETVGDYVVVTVIEQDAQGCRFRTSVTWRGKEIPDVKEFAPVQGETGMQPSKESILLYIEDARVKHADKCHKVRSRAQKEQQRRGQRMIVAFAALELIMIAAVVAGYVMWSKPVEPPADPTPAIILTPEALPSPTITEPSVPDLHVRYAVVRSTLDTDPQAGTTVTLNKDDVLTITVIDEKTGATVAQEIVNLRVAK